MEEIVVKGLTKDYGHGRGIYDVTFEVKNGEVFGFLGPNGAGKSTTMRHLMGFSKPQAGDSYIHGSSCWKNHADVMKQVGYIPGEVALPDGLDAKGFLNMMQKLRRSDAARTEELVQMFQLNLETPMKRMSIGEKRKLAVVAAFMSDSPILLLDEPTSGLDPVMQEVFIDFMKKEKQRGKTVLLSSHIFSEVEALCDRIAIIKEGKIVSVVSAEDVRHYKRKTFEVTFKNMEDFKKMQKSPFEIRGTFPDDRKLAVAVDDAKCDQFIKYLTNYPISNLIEHQQTLEEYFMKFYKSDRNFGGISNEKRKHH